MKRLIRTIIPAIKNYINLPAILTPLASYKCNTMINDIIISNVITNSLESIYKKKSFEEYDMIINLKYKKYYMAFIFDSLIKNCLVVENEETLKFVCEKIAKIIPEEVFREMRMKIPLLCKEVIKVNPYTLLAVPYDMQTTEFCTIATELSNGKYFCWVAPQGQTYDIAVKAVIYDGKNLEFVRNDLIDENIINIALKSNGEAIKYIKNPTRQNYIDAITSNPFCISVIKDMDNELYMLAIKINPMVLQFVDESNQTNEMCTYAVSNCDDSVILDYVRKQTPEICKLAIEKNPKSKIFVRNYIDNKK